MKLNKFNRLLSLVVGLCLMSPVWAEDALNTQAGIEKHKQEIKYNYITEKRYVPTVLFADRYRADALLELAAQGVILPNHSEKSQLRPAEEIILAMPRIDILQKHIANLSKKTKHLYLFIMENDKQVGVYGDRSYQTLIKKGVDKKLPKNVKLFKLKDESVTEQAGKNHFEYPSNIFRSAVFTNQIWPTFNKITTVSKNKLEE